MNNMLQQIVPLDELKIWDANPLKRCQASDKELETSVREVGIKQPLAVLEKGNYFLVVDGNRRLRIAQRLGLKSVPVIVYHNEDPYELAVILNTIVRPWDGQTIGQLVANNEDILPRVPKRYRLKLEGAIHLLGYEGFQTFIQVHSLNTYDIGMRVARYVERGGDPDFCRKAVIWVGNHRASLFVRMAMEADINPKVLLKAVLKNEKPILTLAGTAID